LSILASLLAVSRVYAGIHYPSDILGGMVVGLVSSMIVDSNKEFLEKTFDWILAAWNSIETNIIYNKQKVQKLLMGRM
jgi:undecaprenyl-diphosphatase